MAYLKMMGEVRRDTTAMGCRLCRRVTRSTACGLVRHLPLLSVGLLHAPSHSEMPTRPPARPRALLPTQPFTHPPTHLLRCTTPLGWTTRWRCPHGRRDTSESWRCGAAELGWLDAMAQSYWPRQLGHGCLVAAHVAPPAWAIDNHERSGCGAGLNGSTLAAGIISSRYARHSLCTAGHCNLSLAASHRFPTAQVWNEAEAALEEALNATGREWEMNPGDGAFYGE